MLIYDKIFFIKSKGCIYMKRNDYLALTEETKTAVDTIIRMGEGKPYTLSILNHLLTLLGSSDFMDAMNVLDSIGIRGSNIAILFLEKNKADFQKFISFINLLKTDSSTIVETKNSLGI